MKHLAESTDEETVVISRTDPYDLAELAAKVAISWALSELKKKKEKYDRVNDPDEEDYTPFDLSVDSVTDEAEDFLKEVIEKIDEYRYGTKLNKLVAETHKDLPPKAPKA